jgi:hypothetical protein
MRVANETSAWLALKSTSAQLKTTKEFSKDSKSI